MYNYNKINIILEKYWQIKLVMELFLHLGIPVLLPKRTIAPQKTPYELSEEVSGEAVDEQSRAGPQGGAFGLDRRPDRKREKLPPGDQKEDHPGVGPPAQRPGKDF